MKHLSVRQFALMFILDMAFKIRDGHWHILLEAMEQNTSLATGKFIGAKGKETYKKLWDETATKLNALGFGSKPTERWQKVIKLV